ncbi:phosphoribosylformylglycinamidine synthase [Paramarasmius palmivorus]|uniref:Phosphoribosylformylglycinamidine synthase n=1 Tax=Paramarasmius palmivorus TaxID=297713 RepID=A0AAW0CJ43_9AGAR
MGLGLPTGNVVARATLQRAVERLMLRLPSIASKSFLITIGDRSITGLVCRDQMVGPWQVPVADVGVVRTTYPRLSSEDEETVTGEAMCMGERPPLAILNPAASARIAVAEALTNLVAAYLGPSSLHKVKLSANWMANPSKPGQGAALYSAVEALGMDLCPKLGVGASSGDTVKKEVSSPVSVVITAFAGVVDVRQTWTPQLLPPASGGGELIFVDLASGKTRLAGSALAQVFGSVVLLGQDGRQTPDLTGDDVGIFKAFVEATQLVRQQEQEVVLAYHDRSDGGLFTTIVEMAFAGRTGVDIYLPEGKGLEWLFNEELGAVFQVKVGGLDSFKKGVCEEVVWSSTRGELQRMWAETSFKIQEIRDDPDCAKEEFALIEEKEHSGLFYDLTFTPTPSPLLTSIKEHQRPRVAILREQGVNGHVEMGYAFYAAGFLPVDVHMSDLLSTTPAQSLSTFVGLAACGGFSYGDVLGAGKGWAHSVLLHPRARDEFKTFFERDDTFTLAVCNGCQFLSHLREIIPNGAEAWPEFKENKSGRFEARVCMVEIVDTEATRKSVFLRGMKGSKLPVAVAHGEGHVAVEVKEELVGVRYVDSKGEKTEKYPLNPNGSLGGVTGVQTSDGRVLAMMPHPERVVLLESNSWIGEEVSKIWRKQGGGRGPWMRLFESAREWCDERANK